MKKSPQFESLWRLEWLAEEFLSPIVSNIDDMLQVLTCVGENAFLFNLIRKVGTSDFLFCFRIAHIMVVCAADRIWLGLG